MANHTNSEDWKRYFDDENQFFYFYNASTGESKWDDTVDSGSVNATTAFGEVECSNVGDFNQTEVIENANQRVFTAAGRDSMYESEEDDVNQEVGEDAQSSPLSASSPSSSSSRRFIGTNRSYRALLHFDFIILLMNAVFIEAPLCIVEGVLRCIALFSWLSILYLSPFCFQRSNLHHSVYVILEDIIFTLSAVVVLCIPGAIVIIYRNYADDDWEVSPLPTLIGWVDMRRFGAVTLLGNASLASNIDTNNCRSENSGGDDEEDKERNSSHRKQDALWKCMWRFFPQPSETLIFVPHEMIRSCNDYLQAID